MLALFRHSPWSALSVPRGQGTLARIDAAFRLWSERQDLALLDETMLRDLGLTEADVAREAARPVWDAPGWWT